VPRVVRATTNGNYDTSFVKGKYTVLCWFALIQSFVEAGHGGAWL
jgi:hypothetical protein